jgi:hypothetical protein
MKTLPKENGPHAPFSNEIIELLNTLNLEITSTLFRLIATHAWIKGAEKASNKQQAKLMEATHIIKTLREEIGMLKQIIDANNLQSDIGQFIKPIDEPVAMRYDFDGYGYKYIDSGSGSDWQTREKGEFLYTKPFFQQKPVAMMVKMDGFDKPEFTTTCSSAALKHPNYTALYDHPPIAFAELKAKENRESAIYATGYWNGISSKKLRELTDEEISQVYKEVSEPFGEKRLYEIHDFARAILKKASEK